MNNFWLINNNYTCVPFDVFRYSQLVCDNDNYYFVMKVKNMTVSMLLQVMAKILVKSRILPQSNKSKNVINIDKQNYVIKGVYVKSLIVCRVNYAFVRLILETT